MLILNSNIVDIKKKTVVVMPALNESHTIKKVIVGVRNYVDVIVVDDGSIDGTAKIASQCGAQVIEHKKKLGYEQALITGFDYASMLGYEYVITIDADGQHLSSDIPLFLNELSVGSQLVIGCRDNLPRFSEKIFSIISRLIWNLQDPLSGMKAYKLSTLKKFMPYENNKTVCADMVVKQVVNKVKCSQIHISVRKRADNSRFGSYIKANYKILKALMYLLWKYWKIKK